MSFVISINTQEIDVTSLVILSQERSEAFDWTEFLYLEEHTVGYKRPVIESDITGFYRPFSGQVWWLVAAVVVVVPVSHTVLRWAYRQLPRRELHSKKSLASQQQRLTVSTDARDSIMWMLSALLAQSLPLTPPKGVVRVLTGLWLLLALILVTVYRSNLKAMLILPKINLPFDNLDQLTHTGIPVWVSLNSMLHAAAVNGEKNSTMGRFNSLINSVGKPNNVTQAIVDLIEGLQALAAPRSALVQILHSHFTRTGKCPTYLMSESFLKTNIGCLILPKYSSLKDQLDPIDTSGNTTTFSGKNYLEMLQEFAVPQLQARSDLAYVFVREDVASPGHRFLSDESVEEVLSNGVRNWREFGILNRMYHQGVVNAEECLKPISARLDSWRALSLEDFYGVFLVYCCGIGIASIKFMVELTLRRLPSLHISHA
ncbi:hypothetical protein O3P69_002267 [Scylla paramamosain]|uniref:Ionotropic glutamate receptor C-terminal domain-containing protein n=1 Tax=Scylla paramamosain TaxID=85552 RepID=A0AAW0V5I2_SCYPA